MESQFPEKSFIEKIAQILMAEGDIETAKSLEKQLKGQPSREMTKEEVSLYKLNKSNVVKAFGFGNFERAVEFQSVAFGLAQRAFGAEHVKTLKDSCKLGDCHFRNRSYQIALDLYYRTLRISTTKFGEQHQFTNRVKKNINECTEAVRAAKSLKNLEQHINSVFRMSTPIAPLEKSARIDRLEVICEKLVNRGRHSRAFTLYKELTGLCLDKAHHNDEKMIQNIMKYANFFTAFGYIADSEETYKSLVKIMNRQNQMGDNTNALKIVISNWANCLSQIGHSRSALESQGLASKLAMS